MQQIQASNNNSSIFKDFQVPLMSSVVVKGIKNTCAMQETGV